MSQQKMRRILKETSEECRNIKWIVTIKQRAKERKFVTILETLSRKLS